MQVGNDNYNHKIKVVTVKQGLYSTIVPSGLNSSPFAQISGSGSLQSFSSCLDVFSSPKDLIFNIFRVLILNNLFTFMSITFLGLPGTAQLTQELVKHWKHKPGFVSVAAKKFPEFPAW